MANYWKYSIPIASIGGGELSINSECQPVEFKHWGLRRIAILPRRENTSACRLPAPALAAIAAGAMTAR